MSEKSKGDTSSSSLIPPSTRIIKNPLLSASVTGISFDDFPNKPLLLPAAPAVTCAPIPAPHATAPSHHLSTGIHNRETKSLVIVGQKSDIDNDTLSEINLNSNADETQAAQIDTNSNSLLEKITNSDSILSQAASSFSALPSVASTVFSTFSKRIYPTSSSRERTPAPSEAADTNANSISQLDIQPPYIQQQHQPHHQQYRDQQRIQGAFPTSQLLHPNVSLPKSASPPSAYFPVGPLTSLPGPQSAPPPQIKPLISAPPQEPPTFYSPTEIPANSAAAVSSTPTGVINTYRLSAKKKFYAPIPGFSQTASPATVPTIDPSVITAPIIYNSPPQQTPQHGYSSSEAPTSGQYQAQLQSNTGESKNGLFSIGNLVPTNVLQNISGPVQSAAGTITQTVTQEPAQYQSFTSPPSQQQQQISVGIDYFGVPSSGVPTGNFPAPPPSFNVTPTSNNLFTPQIPSFYGPADHQQQAQPLQTNYHSITSPQNFFVPQVSQTIQPTTSSTLKQPLPEIPGPPRILAPQTVEGSTPSSVPFFPATNLQAAQIPQGAVVDLVSTTTSASSLSTSVPHISSPTSQQLPRGPSECGPYIDPATFLNQTPPTAVNILDPRRPPSQTSIHNNPRALFQPAAPTLPSGTPLPPANTARPLPAGGPSNFRLQKGTRLYKSPLTPSETAPRYINQAPLEQTSLGQAPHLGQYSTVTHSLPPPSIFNPFGSSTAAAASVEQRPALIVPESDHFPVPEHRSGSSLPVEGPLATKPLEFFNPITASDKRQKSTEVGIQLQQTHPNVTIPEETQPIAANTTTSPVTLESTSQSVEDNFKVAVTEQTIEAVFSEQQSNKSVSQLENAAEESSDPLDRTLHKLLLEESVKKEEPSECPPDFLPPPPQLNSSQGIVNPYRKELAAGTTAGSTANTITDSKQLLASFFTPVSSNFKGTGDFNFFATTSTTASAAEPADAFAPGSAASFFNTVEFPASENSTLHLFEKQTPTAPTESVDLTLGSDSFPQLPAQTSIVPLALFEEPSKEDACENPLTGQLTIAPPLGFDNIVSDSNTSAESSTVEISEKKQLQTEPNSISNFFNTTSECLKSKTSNILETQKNLPSYFEPFAAPPSSSTVTQSPVQSVTEPSLTKAPLPSTAASPIQITTRQTNEDQRLQNFFNNPPPQELDGSIQDLNYELVHSGLSVKCQEPRSLTPASNLVEPPSSTCSEFSELNNSFASLVQRQNPFAESSSKISPEEENRAPSLVDNSSENTKETEVKKPESEDLFKDYADLPEEIIQAIKMAHAGIDDKDERDSASGSSAAYTAVVKHWFYKRVIGPKTLWTPFSHYDSALLETSFVMEDEASNVVAVEGGRYDVNIAARTKVAVYWEDKPMEVRRCSWFYKGNDSRYIPYEENISDLLEAEYKLVVETGEWHKKITIAKGEQVVFHGPTLIVHFQLQQNVEWVGSGQTTTRSRVVKRDLDDFSIDAGECQHVDHLLFVVHGIGSACDLKFRSVEEVVDDFRTIAQQLVSAHYKNSSEMGLVGRVEILPISWHGHLHSAEMGIDEKLKSITLESIPKLRHFTNDTLLDVLFYTSPNYCQMIMNTVAASMNSVYARYRQRNPEFMGGVSLAGHSLGSLILFDLLCHQQPVKESTDQNVETPDQQVLLSIPANLSSKHASVSNTNVDSGSSSYTMGSAGTGQPFINYVQLSFQPKKFFALGSPIGVFVTIRGIDKLGLDFRLPTCSGFYNIFHPFDPVAYRIEALVNPDMSNIPPVLVPHHKGRKRMHLELKETVTRVGADLKQRFFDTLKNRLETVNFLGSGVSTSKGTKENETKELMQKEVDKVLQMQMQLDQQQDAPTPRTLSTSASDNEMVEIDIPLGKLNDSKRIDYVLQEAPLEFFNEYLFAISSHVCYWESEDTILFVMKEIYSGLGINADSRVPQQSLTVERPSLKSSNSNANSSSPSSSNT